MCFTDKEIADNHASLQERNAYYRTFGYDVDKSVAFVLSKALPLTGRILEVGTGKGRFLAELSKIASDVTTIDLDPAEQRFARMNVAHANPTARVEFVVGDAARLPWEARSFDAVVSMHALHHVRDLSGVVDEALRVARPTGKIVLADFSDEGFAVMDVLHTREGRIHTRVPYSFQDIVGRLAEAGWNTVICSGDHQEVLVAYNSRLRVAERMKFEPTGEQTHQLLSR